MGGRRHRSADDSSVDRVAPRSGSDRAASGRGSRRSRRARRSRGGRAGHEHGVWTGSRDRGSQRHQARPLRTGRLERGRRGRDRHRDRPAGPDHSAREGARRTGSPRTRTGRRDRAHRRRSRVGRACGSGAAFRRAGVADDRVLRPTFHRRRTRRCSTLTCPPSRKPSRWPVPPQRPPISHAVTDQRYCSPGERSSRPVDLRRSAAVHARRRVAADRRPPLVAERALSPTGDLAAVLRTRPQLERPLPQLRRNRGVFDAHPRSGSVAIRTPSAGPTPEKAGRRRPTSREEPPRSRRCPDRDA